MDPYASFWARENREPPASDDEIRACEREFGVTFPDSFRRLWREHNGGPGGLAFLPLSSDRRQERIRPLSALAEPPESWLTAESLETIAEEIGDPQKLLALAFDGGYCYVLDFHHRSPHEMPRVAMLDLGGDFMFEDWQVLADSFDAFAESARGR